MRVGRRGACIIGLSCAVACGGKNALSGAPSDDAAGGAAFGATGGQGQPSAGSGGFDGAAAGALGALGGGPTNGANGGALAVGGNGAHDAGATSGGNANAGATSGGTGGAAAEPCEPGAVRCETVREHCDANGVWLKESFVCATDLTGSIEQKIVCAVKSDGRMTCFGPSFDPFSAPLIAHAPERKWAKLILTDDVADASDHELCGIDVAGSGACWSASLSARRMDGLVTQFAPGSQGLCLVNAEGALICPVDQGINGLITPDAGPLQDLVMRNGFLFGLGRSGSVSAPFSRFALPSGSYGQISASSSGLCAVRTDHQLFCAPTALPPALAAQRFLHVAVGYWGDLCAIREDHSVICDPLGTPADLGNPPGEFTRLVMVTGAVCGIRTDGSLACFGTNAPVPPADW